MEAFSVCISKFTLLVEEVKISDRPARLVRVGLCDEQYSMIALYKK